jgi:hypothetical protein
MHPLFLQRSFSWNLFFHLTGRLSKLQKISVRTIQSHYDRAFLGFIKEVIQSGAQQYQFLLNDINY